MRGVLKEQRPKRSTYWRCARVLVMSAAVVNALVWAAEPQVDTNPAGKIYVSAVTGSVLIRINGRIQPLMAKTAYPAIGVAMETGPGSSATIVLSNGTGVTLGPGTRIEVKRFEQEPFKPGRSDFELEPSVSDTQLVVLSGTINIATNKLAAGSTLRVETPSADLNSYGGRLVIAVGDAGTKVSVLDGSCIVRGATAAIPDQAVRSGEVAVATRAAAGQTQQTAVQVEKMPAQQIVALDDQVATSSFARKTVYFEVKETPGNTGNIITTSDAASTKQPAPTDSSKPADNSVNAFTSTGNTTGGSTTTGSREIVPVAVVPIELPVQFTVSPARIVGP